MGVRAACVALLASLGACAPSPADLLTQAVDLIARREYHAALALIERLEARGAAGLQPRLDRAAVLADAGAGSARRAVVYLTSAADPNAADVSRLLFRAWSLIGESSIPETVVLLEAWAALVPRAEQELSGVLGLLRDWEATAASMEFWELIACPYGMP